MLDKVDLWPTPVYGGVVNSITDFELQSSLNFIFNLVGNYNGAKKSNVGGWQSDPCNVGDYPIIDEIFTKISPYIDQISKDFNVELFVANYWINVNFKGSFNIDHTHPSSAFAGVFYLRNSTGQGDLVLNKPNSFFERHIVHSESISQYYDDYVAPFSIKPQPKHLIFFPGFIPHLVTTNETDEPRVSIAFNLKVK